MPNALKIGLMVEGQGDQLALPELVRNVAFSRGIYDISIPTPFRVKRGRFAPAFTDYERALQVLAAKAERILVVIDADDDCPVELAQGLLQRATTCVGHRPVHVAIAHHEFEAWLIAGIESYQDHPAVSLTAEVIGADPDSIRNAKSAFRGMLTGNRYSETVDQVRFASMIDFDVTAQKSRSFRKFMSELDAILTV